jgi:hypothetical protein
MVEVDGLAKGIFTLPAVISGKLRAAVDGALDVYAELLDKRDTIYSHAKIMLLERRLRPISKRKTRRTGRRLMSYCW